MQSGADANKNSPSEEQQFQVEFVGDAREYFRLWVVNLCLTLLTLGVFSAWAKVRKQRYIYSHTIVDGSPFQYAAQPLPILKGRLIALVLFLIYYLTQYVAPQIMPYVLSGLVVLLPWVINRSLAFRARYTGFRNMTFGFHGTYEGAIKAVYWLGLIPFLILAIVFESWGDFRILAVAGGAAAILFPWWMQRMKRYMVSSMSFGGRRATFSASGWQYFKIYFVSGLIIAVGGAITGFSFALLSIQSEVMIYVAVVPVYLFYVIAFAYVRAKAGNLVWNSSQIDCIQFRSTLETWGLFSLYLTNAIGILVSVGLLIPWAVMRTIRYRASKLSISVDGSLTQFRGSQATSVSAAGSEVGEMFDLELAL